MKRLLLGSTAIVLLLSTCAQAGYVRGYTRKDGTYVAPYYRGGGSSAAPSYTSPTPSYSSPAPSYATPTLTTATPRITTYPTSFKGKPCGKSFISQAKQCLVDTPQQKLTNFRNCTEAWENGVADIPRTSPAYADKLDRDHDGIACEVSDMYNGTHWMYGIEADAGAAVSSVDYVPVDALSELGTIPTHFLTPVPVTINGKTVTYEAGVPLSTEDQQIPAPFVYQGLLMVPVKSLELFGCTGANSTEGMYAIQCANGTRLSNSLFYRW